jgi:hypothetical protein
MRYLGMILILGALSFVGANSAVAGPPSYLLLRRTESPAAPAGGHDGARGFDARGQGYAYGHFGACPHPQPQRQFGINRTYTQWSFW